MLINAYNMSHVMRKTVYGGLQLGKLKPACSATETSNSLEMLDLESIGIMQSRQRTTKVLIRLQMHRLICAFVVRIWHR